MPTPQEKRDKAHTSRTAWQSPCLSNSIIKPAPQQHATLTVKSSVMIFPSEPLSLMAERRPSKKLLCLLVSTLWMGMSATWSARWHSRDRWHPTAPISSMFPLQTERRMNKRQTQREGWIKEKTQTEGWTKDKHNSQTQRKNQQKTNTANKHRAKDEQNTNTTDKHRDKDEQKTNTADKPREKDGQKTNTGWTKNNWRRGVGGGVAPPHRKPGYAGAATATVEATRHQSRCNMLPLWTRTEGRTKDKGWMNKVQQTDSRSGTRRWGVGRGLGGWGGG